jgi:hypothetical protein
MWELHAACACAKIPESKNTSAEKECYHMVRAPRMLFWFAFEVFRNY